jgi:hypothetical protein
VGRARPGAISQDFARLRELVADGAVFDVGCYPVSFAVGVAAAAGVDVDAASGAATAVEQVRGRVTPPAGGSTGRRVTAQAGAPAVR